MSQTEKQPNFWWAIFKNNLDEMKKYCENNPLPDLPGSMILKCLQYPPIHLRIEIIQFLIEKGYSTNYVSYSVNHHNGLERHNALMTICESDRYPIEVFPVIFQAKNLDLYAQDYEGNTALDLAIKQNHTKAMLYLIEHGVKIENCKPENQAKLCDFLLKQKLDIELEAKKMAKIIKV